jgi:SPP1 family predicted phage head-tail adaptor
MRAGTLRHQLQIDRPVDTQDATGDPVRTWEEVGTFWGSIEPLRGREFGTGQAILGEMDTRIRIRWALVFDEVDETFRIRHRGRVYNIVSVAHVALHQRELEIMAKSGVNQG